MTDRKPMTALEIAERAYALIEDPARWTQGALARNAKGESTLAGLPDAVCWCSTGAYLVATHESGYDARNAVLKALSEVFVPSVPEFNDAHTHAEVLAGWRKAIESLKE